MSDYDKLYRGAFVDQNEIIVHPESNNDLTLVGGDAYRLYYFLWSHPLGDLTIMLRFGVPTDDAVTYCNDQIVIRTRLFGKGPVLYPPLENGEKIHLKTA